MHEHLSHFQPNPDLRVGDSEREQTADRLRSAHGEGRLDADEFQERIGRCYEAKTVGELQDLVADLPGEQRHGRSSRQFWLMPRWRAALPILFAVILVGAVIHGHHGQHGHVLWAVLPLVFLAWLWAWRRRPYSRP